MKDQIAITPNGVLVIAIPLFRLYHDFWGPMGYYVQFSNKRPMAYLIDYGYDSGIGLQLMKAEAVEEWFTFLGDF